jgi:hypothetical protein
MLGDFRLSRGQFNERSTLLSNREPVNNLVAGFLLWADNLFLSDHGNWFFLLGLILQGWLRTHSSTGEVISVYSGVPNRTRLGLPAQTSRPADRAINRWWCVYISEYDLTADDI